MAFLVSPGVQVNEFNISTVIPAVAATSGAIAGVFQWGPVNTPILVGSEVELRQQFFTPANFNAETWFSAANFLGYSNQEYICRGADLGGNTVVVSNASVNTAVSTNSIAMVTASFPGLNVGQVLFYYNNTSAQFVGQNPTITSINSTSVGLNTTFTGNVATLQVVFRDNNSYGSIAQETVDQTLGGANTWGGVTVANTYDYQNKLGTFASSARWISRYPGAPANSLRVSQCDNALQYSSVLAAANATNILINATASAITVNNGTTNVVFTVVPTNTAIANTTSQGNAYAWAVTQQAAIAVNDILALGNASVGWQYIKVSSIGAVSNTANATIFSSSQFTVTLQGTFGLTSNISSNTVTRYWEFYNLVTSAPGQSPYQLQYGNTSANDQLHIVVVDQLGEFSTSPGTVLEVYNNVSRATDAVNEDGTSNYYANVVSTDSQYILFANDRTTAVSNLSPYVVSSTGTAPLNMQMYGASSGLSETAIDVGALTTAWNYFLSTESFDIGLLIAGKARGTGINNYTTLGQYLIQNIAQIRKDCVAFISPDISDVVNNIGFEATSIINFRDSLTSSSYGVLDTGYKYQYDGYNNIYRWIPLNADIAGLCARTDLTNDPWWSPGGFNRGQINNVVKLAYNPPQTDRDVLYPAGINPVVSFPGLGVVLYGDKTLLSNPSAFDRINVRRLFIVLEKAIATAAKYLLFEFNDSFTQATFKSMVNPYLRDVQGRRGIQDFLVVCDSTNNTASVIDANQFVGDIYIKPARSINFINLNFVAVGTGVAFSEVVGQYGQL